MLIIDEKEKKINITYGDVGAFLVEAEDENGENYVFKIGDVVRLKVYRPYKPSEVMIQKDVVVTEEGNTQVNISLDKEDTEFEKLLKIQKDFWYEIILNHHDNPNTIIGFDKEGPKIFTIYPKGGEK